MPLAAQAEASQTNIKFDSQIIELARRLQPLIQEVSSIAGNIEPEFTEELEDGFELVSSTDDYSGLSSTEISQPERELQRLCSTISTKIDTILANREMPESEQTKLLASLYKKIDKIPGRIAEVYGVGLKQLAEKEINGEANKSLPVIADLALIRGQIQNRMYALGKGEQGFADKNPISYPHPVYFPISIAMAGLTYLLGLGFSGGINKVKDSPNAIVKLELVAEKDPKNPQVTNLKWVDRLGESSSEYGYIRAVQPLKEGVVAQVMTNEYRENPVHNAKSVLCFFGGFISAIVSIVAGGVSLERDKRGEMQRLDPYSKIHRQLRRQDDDLFIYRRKPEEVTPQR